MTKSVLKGNWNVQRGELKQKFASFTENDLKLNQNNEDEKHGKSHIKLIKSKKVYKK